eukprot:CAMPEP_0183308300 /NCGR_PEP_ID=MMETSP0160_2-20130417/21178_1 /TAXON_ID=2839 ORGANISM="Odontella Sinensis, Strain Grunow 1884" /NCGR_SAMPLE_ID=MMETSP0160_2 /ASSEMBLY_ACC=CAM_ASM_000250 /LENGTH=40 /DNA_ID= /DNA_START= /DNA_END= /DNA_ORIENTATION=
MMGPTIEALKATDRREEKGGAGLKIPVAASAAAPAVPGAW